MAAGTPRKTPPSFNPDFLNLIQYISLHYAKENIPDFLESSRPLPAFSGSGSGSGGSGGSAHTYCSAPDVESPPFSLRKRRPMGTE